MTVETLKELIEKQGNVPVSLQRLIYKGHILRDANTLASYGTKRPSVIDQTFRAR